MPAGAQGPWETEEERTEAARGARRVERLVDRGGAAPLPPGPQSPSHHQPLSLPPAPTPSPLLSPPPGRILAVTLGWDSWTISIWTVLVIQTCCPPCNCLAWGFPGLPHTRIT